MLLTYGCDIYTLIRDIENKANAFKMGKIANIKLSYRINNELRCPKLNAERSLINDKKKQKYFCFYCIAFFGIITLLHCLILRPKNIDFSKMWNKRKSQEKKVKFCTSNLEVDIHVLKTNITSRSWWCAENHCILDIF